MPWKHCAAGNGCFPEIFVPAQIDTKYDVMNEKKQFWVHPCDDQISSNASFNDLFDEAVSIAVDAIQTAFDCIVEGKDIEELCNLLKDRAYVLV